MNVHVSIFQKCLLHGPVNGVLIQKHVQLILKVVHLWFRYFQMYELSEFGFQKSTLKSVSLVVDFAEKVQRSPLRNHPNQLGVQAAHVNRQADDVVQIEYHIRYAFLDEAFHLQEVT